MPLKITSDYINDMTPIERNKRYMEIIKEIKSRRDELKSKIEEIKKFNTENDKYFKNNVYIFLIN